MKKLLIGIGIIALFCFGAQYWANLPVNGSILKSDPTYTGTLTIQHTANQTYNFTADGPGSCMTFGPGNTVDFGAQSLTALTRGAVFGSTTTGTYALSTSSGSIRLMYNTGNYRMLIGPNITDDGSTQMQLTGGIKATALNLGATTAGYVLTADASGNYTPQAPSSGTGTGGNWTPTNTGVTNVTSITTYAGDYTVNGSFVTVMLPFAVSATSSNTNTVFTATLPFTAVNTATEGGSGTIHTGTGDAPVNVTISSTTKAQISFITPGTNPSGYVVFMYKKQ